MGALESAAKSEALAVAKGMANMANAAVGAELKIVIQTAQRAAVIKGAENTAREWRMPRKLEK